MCPRRTLALLSVAAAAAGRVPVLPTTDGSSLGRGEGNRDNSTFSGAGGLAVGGDGAKLADLAGGAIEDGVLLFELGQRPYRTRRRLAGALLEYEDTPLYPGYGTHFAYIYVGEPAQRVSVIVDTGSHFTAFPCVGCNNCGDHTDPYYDYHSSATGSVVQCSECQVNFRCNRAAREGSCLFSQSYSEGSSWSAFQVKDHIWVGELTLDNTPAGDKEFEVEMMFGCINSQTGLFRTQLADGIMGMSANEYTLAWQMVKQGVTRHTTFALCLSEGGGTMTLGGNDPLVAAGGAISPIAWTPLVKDTGWFTVEVVDVLLGGETIGAPASLFNAGKGTIVDSGTTDTYLPEACEPQFKAAWKRITGMDYRNAKYTLTDKQVAALPTLTFRLGNDVDVTVQPWAYMERSGDRDWTPRVYIEESSGGVLGANFMREHNIIFDHDGGRMGFQDATCDYGQLLKAKEAQRASKPPAPLPTPSPTLPQSAPVPPPVPSSQPVDCVHAGMELIEACDAKCPLGASEASVVTGTETWGPIVTSPAQNGGYCPRPEQRSCNVSCKAGATNPMGGGSVVPGETTGCAGAGGWGVCGAGCQQSRVVSWPSEGSGAAGGAGDGALGGCSVESETRQCRVGDMCRYGAMGLLVTADLEACFPGAGATDNAVWTGAMSDAVGDAVARLLAMDQGDVACSEASPDGSGGAGATGNRAGAPCFRLPLAVHLTPVVNADLSSEVALTLGGHSFGGQLSRLANADAEDRIEAARLGPVTLAVLQPVLVLQAATRAPYAAALGRATTPPRRTSSGPVMVFSLLAAVAAATCVVLGFALVRRRRVVPPSGSGKRVEYQLVERGAAAATAGASARGRGESSGGASSSQGEAVDGAELGRESGGSGGIIGHVRSNSGGRGGSAISTSRHRAPASIHSGEGGAADVERDFF